MNKDSLATGVILAVLLALVILFARYTLSTLPPGQPVPQASSSKVIPPASQFTIPAVGLPVNDATLAQSFKLPPGNGGLWFFNQTGNDVQVVISNTIATLGITKGFLFILPPQPYELYIYGLSDRPLARSEQVEAGKTHYVYLMPVAPQ